MEKRNITKYIQSAFDELSEKSVRLVDLSDRDLLSQIFSLPYPDSFSTYLKRAIERTGWYRDIDLDSLWDSPEFHFALGEKQRQCGGTESKGTYAERWRKYLTGEIKQPRKMQLLEYCILLDLDEEEALKILAQYDSTGINYRNPEEMLAFYFILQKDAKYNLKHFSKMKKEYELRTKNKAATNAPAPEVKNYTITAKALMEKARWQKMDEELLDFMVENCDELTDENLKTGNNRYSITQAENLLQMLRYIFVLMEFTPDKENSYNKKINRVASYVNYEKRSWYADLIRLAGEGAIGVEKRRKGRETPQKVYDYLDSVRSHIYSIENRVAKIEKLEQEIEVKKKRKKKAEKEDSPENSYIDPVTRDDVLFFTLMLFVGFMYYPGKKVTPRDLPRKSNGIDVNDEAVLKVDSLIADLYNDSVFMKWMKHHDEMDVKSRYNLVVKYVNRFMEAFNLLKLYPPLEMDRLVLTSLLSESPMCAFCYISNPNYRRK